jgi:hypothetical protein
MSAAVSIASWAGAGLTISALLAALAVALNRRMRIVDPVKGIDFDRLGCVVGSSITRAPFPRLIKNRTQEPQRFRSKGTFKLRHAPLQSGLIHDFEH